MTELGINPDTYLRPQSANMLKILKHILYCDYEDICVSGPLGTSKTTNIWWAINFLAISTGNLRCAIVRNEKSTIFTTVQPTIEKLMKWGFLKVSANPFNPVGGETRPQELRYHGGSRVLFGGLDDAQKIMGLEPNLVFWNQVERARESDYNDLSARLRGITYDNPFTGKKNTLFLSDANPAGPKHFMLNRKRMGVTKMFPTTLEDNVGYYQNGKWTEAGLAYKRRLDLSYPHEGYQRDRMVHGLWVGSEGMIFPQFREAIHVKPLRLGDIPSDWKWQGAVDYGKTHPAAYGLWTVSPDYKRTWLFKQILKTGFTASAFIPEITALNKKFGAPKRVRIVGDPASDHNETLRDAGLNVKDAKKEVLFGIDVVRQWFNGLDGREILINEDALAHEPDPKLVSGGKPTWIVDELFEYSHLPEDRQTTGSERDDLPDKRKGSDDSCDMMRYHLVDITRGPSGYVPIGRNTQPIQLPDFGANPF